MTERLPLARLSVVRATMSAAVPEHSICTEETRRNAESRVSRDWETPRSRKSRHWIGSPAVGGTSRHDSGMALLRLAEAQQDDAQHDANGASEFQRRENFVEQDERNKQNQNHFEM